VRISFRIAVTLATAAVIAPAAFAAGPTATTAAPTVQTTPQPAPQGSAFGPLQGLGTNAQPAETTVTTKRASDSDNGRGTLLFLSLVSIILIFAVVGFIWYEGRTTRAEAKRRRQRMRSGRTPQPATAGEGRRGPPPPPRKRRAQAKRKKR
jgi:flagellar basal body-associated protein FliL